MQDSVGMDLYSKQVRDSTRKWLDPTAVSIKM